MPTLLELAGAEYPQEFNGYAIQPVEGRSLLPLVTAASRPGTTNVWEHEGNRAIRQGDYKLVSSFGSDWELFDLRLDRFEANDLLAVFELGLDQVLWSCTKTSVARAVDTISVIVARMRAAER
jgi:arylsulfatase A-like enzyme